MAAKKRSSKKSSSKKGGSRKGSSSRKSSKKSSSRKSSTRSKAAKKGADWAVTPDANKLYAESYAIVALPGIAAPLDFIEGDISKMLIKNDFAWAAANRERILAEWSKRYDGKSEPKS